MKILTKEQEDAHYNAVLKGGSVGTALGLAGGWAGVMLASRRWAGVRNLTLPMKAFLVTSSGTFTGIIAADHSSRNFDEGQNSQKTYVHDLEQARRQHEISRMSTTDRMMDFMHREKYKVIGLSWVGSMMAAWAFVARTPMTGPQKLVQARVYAQGLTVAMMCAVAAFEIHDQRKGSGFLDSVKAKRAREAASGKQVQEDMWKDMVDAEEKRLKEKEERQKIKH